MNDQWLGTLEAAKSALEATSDESLRVPCYCEENVWRLAYRKVHQQEARDSKTYNVVFVSNPKSCVPMFEQKAASEKNTPVCWDYHVLLFMTVNDTQDSVGPKTYVLDIDSHLPFPCPLDEYIEKSFLNHKSWMAEYLPYFRVVDAATYLRHFSSDRSHMYNPVTKTWNAPPPSYECILPSGTCDKPNSENTKTKEVISTLKQYMTISSQNIDLQQQHSEDCPFGRIYSLSQLLQRFG